MATNNMLWFVCNSHSSFGKTRSIKPSKSSYKVYFGWCYSWGGGGSLLYSRQIKTHKCIYAWWMLRSHVIVCASPDSACPLPHTRSETDGHGERYSLRVFWANCFSDMSRAVWYPVIISSLWSWVRHKGCLYVPSHKISTIQPCVTFQTQEFWGICGHGLLVKRCHVKQRITMTLSLPESLSYGLMFCSFLARFNVPSTTSLSLPFSFLGCYDMRPCCTVTGNDGWSLWMSNTIRAKGQRERDTHTERERYRGLNLGILI